MPIDISQVRALGARLENAGRRVGAGASQLLRVTAFRIEADGKTFAPVDTGFLRSSISTTVTGNGATHVKSFHCKLAEESLAALGGGR